MLLSHLLLLTVLLSDSGGPAAVVIHDVPIVTAVVGLPAGCCRLHFFCKHTVLTFAGVLNVFDVLLLLMLLLSSLLLLVAGVTAVVCIHAIVGISAVAGVPVVPGVLSSHCCWAPCNRGVLGVVGVLFLLSSLLMLATLLLLASLLILTCIYF